MLGLRAAAIAVIITVAGLLPPPLVAAAEQVPGMDHCKRGLLFEPWRLGWRWYPAASRDSLGWWERAPRNRTTDDAARLELKLLEARPTPGYHIGSSIGPNNVPVTKVGRGTPSTALSFRGCSFRLEGHGMSRWWFKRLIRGLQAIHPHYPPRHRPDEVTAFIPRDACGLGEWFRRKRVGVDEQRYLTSALDEIMSIRSVSVREGVAYVDTAGGYGTGSCGSGFLSRALTTTIFQFEHIEAIAFTTEGSCAAFYGTTLHEGSCPADGLIHRSGWERGFRSVALSVGPPFGR